MEADLAEGITRELKGFVAASGTTRALVTTCHVGQPGGQPGGPPEGQQSRLAAVDEQSLRTDLVERAIDGLLVTDGACAWVTRGGQLGTTDADASWFAAAREGFARHGLDLPAFAVVTRSAWLDLVSGEQRSWQRVRSRRRRV